MIYRFLVAGGIPVYLENGEVVYSSVPCAHACVVYVLHNQLYLFPPRIKMIKGHEVATDDERLAVGKMLFFMVPVQPMPIPAVDSQLSNVTPNSPTSQLAGWRFMGLRCPPLGRLEPTSSL